jgi:H+/Cl- antiporter ClcA
MSGFPTQRRTLVFIVVAIVAGLLAIATLLVHDWAEMLFGIEPDEGNGWFEFAVTAFLALVAFGMALLTLADFLKARGQGSVHEGDGT